MGLFTPLAQLGHSVISKLKGCLPGVGYEDYGLTLNVFSHDLYDAFFRSLIQPGEGFIE